ncbi:MAG: HAD-IA family hydrolase [Microbacterium sp.]
MTIPQLRRPKYISFDIYGTLIYYQMRQAVEPLVAGRLHGDDLEEFFHRYRIIRYDEIMEYRPYDEILERSYRRVCAHFGLSVSDVDIATIQQAFCCWGPHPDVPEPLKRMAEHYPLVALSNADDRHLAFSIPRLEAPFHAVFTAEQAGAYKPRLAAFEYMLTSLDAEPRDFLHISSHQHYDLIPMYELGFDNLVFLDRGYDPHLPYYGGIRMTSLDEVNVALGIG